MGTSPDAGAATAAAPRLVVPAAGRRARMHPVLATMRPRQWIKNGLVVAAPAAGAAFDHGIVFLRVGLTGVAFCLLASGIYAINDVRDAAEDRLHPRKRFRPVAAGELPRRSAILLGLGLLAGGLATCTAVGPAVAIAGLGYVAVTLSYSFLWRRFPVLDLLAIAAGFLLRAVAGGVAAPVPLSRAFLAVVASAAVLVASGKRYAELRRLADTPALRSRRSLQSYGQGSLRVMMTLAAAGALLFYLGWALQLPAIHGVPWRPLSALPFSVALFRYIRLNRAGAGEAPEDLVTDRALLLSGIVWIAIFALSVEAA